MVVLKNHINARFWGEQLSKTAIIGLGYVGLPLALAHVQSGIDVLGFDIDKRKLSIDDLINSESDEISQAEFNSLRNSNFEATDNFKRVEECSIIIITVPTPLKVNGLPDLTHIESVITSIKKYLKDGQTIVLESTTYPGTTREIIWPMIEELKSKSINLFLGYSPERLDPGNENFEFRDIPKIISGVNIESEKKVRDHYSRVFNNLVIAKGLEEAELSKILENTYRHVNIALVNELAKFCHELKIDIWNVIDIAKTKPFGFQAFYPGPGVGGHCIPVDPSYLTYEIRRKLGKAFDLIETAKVINDSMPKYIAERVNQELVLINYIDRKPKVLILGATYKENIQDTRETPIKYLTTQLIEKNIEVDICDPLIKSDNLDFKNFNRIAIDDLNFAKYDLVIIGKMHNIFKNIKFDSLGVKVFNLSRKISGQNVINL